MAKLRTAAGMTQEQLAARSGVKRVAIARIEAGSVDPRLSTAAAIAAALRVKVEALVKGAR